VIPKWLEDFVKAGSARVRTIVRSGRPLELAGDAGPSHQVQSLYMQHYGFRSRPGPGTEVATVAILANANQRMGVASEAPGTGPADQADWEVEIYSRTGQRIRLRKDGGLYLEAAGGGKVTLQPNGTVLLNDGGAGAVRLQGGVLTVADDVVARDIARRHDLGRGAAPTGTGAPGLTTATVVGTDRLFRVTIIVGGTDAPPGTPAATCALAAAYGGTAFAQVTRESGGKEFEYSASSGAVIITAAEQWDAGTTHVFVVSTGGVA